MSCSRTQRSDTGEAQTRGPSVSSQALYHWATVLPAKTLSSHDLLEVLYTCINRNIADKAFMFFFKNNDFAEGTLAAVNSLHDGQFFHAFVVVC